MDLNNFIKTKTKSKTKIFAGDLTFVPKSLGPLRKLHKFCLNF